ncbi:MAG: right-handed parallel beta-helix repeat-containing protein [Acidobacteriota bacterium]|nr:right-handed parallel beta-helix repeat-containing protein [Acidobacteriota bacterium]
MNKLISLLCVSVFTFPLGAAADVRSFGAIGNGIADDTQAIQNAINACGVNGTVSFQGGNYLVRGLSLRSQCTYAGAGGATLVLSARNQFLLDISQQSGIRITGLALDGNSQGGAIIAQGYGPVHNIEIDHCDFRNVVAAAWFPANLTIVSTWGFVDSTIESNRFTNISGGIWLTTVQNTNILNNSFTDVTQSDAIYIAPNPVGFPSGDKLRIAGNTGSRLVSIGIEVFRPDPSNGSVLTAPIIENNSFSDWTGVNGMGLSISHGDGAIIRGNRIENVNGQMQANGIEVIVANAQITGNVVAGGFAFGIAVQGTTAPTITGNTITGAGDTAIALTCNPQLGRCSSRNSVISNNLIQNARLIGVKLDNDWTGSQILRNTITRTAGAWPDDNTILFSGVHQSPAPGPGSIDSNNVIQDGLNVVPGFWFCGVRVNGQMAGSTIRNNVVRSQSSTPLGSGLIDNTGNATVGWIISGNQYMNVARAVN